MADWGILMGLGEGLQQFGNAWSTKAKNELAAKLELEREERAEQRQIAREERQRMREEATASQFKIERDGEGVTWRQGYNKFGKRTGAKELASAEDIKQYNFEDTKNTLSLEKVVADTAKAKAEAENLPRKYSREEELHEANLAYKDASTDAQRARAANYSSGGSRGGRGGSSLDEVAGPVNDTDVANALLEEYPDLVKESGLTTSEALELALGAIRNGRKAGKDPLDVFRIALPAYKDKLKAMKGTQKSGGLQLGN